MEEQELLRLRQDFEFRIQGEYKDIVADLRMEKTLLTAKVTMYEQNIKPLNVWALIPPVEIDLRNQALASFKNSTSYDNVAKGTSRPQRSDRERISR